MLARVSLPVARALFRVWVFAVLAFQVCVLLARGSLPLSADLVFAIVWGLSVALYRFRAMRLLCLAISIYTLVVLGAKCLLRIAFVIRHGGMDCHYCQGSPLVFLWQWMLESMILFPGLVVLGLLNYVRLRET